MPDDYFPIEGYVPPIVTYDRDRDCLLSAPPPPAPTGALTDRFVKRGFYMVCRDCGLAEEWCACTLRTPEQPSSDATADGSLVRRIREAKAQMSAPICPLCGRMCAGSCE